jgi:hypothetical protein
MAHSPVDGYAVVEAMVDYGGSFIRSLAECWARADLANQKRLEAAFADEFEKYRAVAEVKRNAQQPVA